MNGIFITEEGKKWIELKLRNINSGHTSFYSAGMADAYKEVLQRFKVINPESEKLKAQLENQKILIIEKQ